MSSEHLQFQTIPKIRTPGHTPTKIKIFSLDILGKPWFTRNQTPAIIAKIKNKKYVRNKVGRSRPLVLENSSFRLIVLPSIIFPPVLSQVSFMLIFYHNSRPACVTEVRMGNNGLTVSDASANGVGRGNNLSCKVRAFLQWISKNIRLQIDTHK